MRAEEADFVAVMVKGANVEVVARVSVYYTILAICIEVFSSLSTLV
jgi:hypothetical protein